MIYRSGEIGGFPGGLTVKILGFHCHGPGSIPGRGTEMSCSAAKKEKKKQKKQDWKNRHLCLSFIKVLT